MAIRNRRISNTLSLKAVISSAQFYFRKPSCLDLVRTISSGSHPLFSTPEQKDLLYHEKLPIFDYGKVNVAKKRMYVFGSAVHGGLGLSHLIKPKKEGHRVKLTMPKPVRQDFGHRHDIRDIATGHGFTLIAVKPSTDNSPILFGCGLNEFSQIGHHAVRAGAPLELLLSIVPIPLPVLGRTRIISMGAGRGHSIVSIAGEGLLSLGDNSSGQCGRYIIADEEYFGSKLVHRIQRFGSTSDEDVIDIASRFDLSVCVTRSGKVFTFGANQKGQLGRGKIVTNEWMPTEVAGDLEGEKVVKVVTSGGSVLAVTEKGDLFGWGCNEWGQVYPDRISQLLYKPTFVPLHPSIGKIKSAAMGDVFSFILNEKGEVYSWGQGKALGLGPSALSVKQPTLIPPPLFGVNEFNPDGQVVGINASYFYAAAINSVGDLYTWGENISGCLGLIKTQYQPFPLKVCLSSTAYKISLGIDHTVVLCKGAI